MTRLRLSPAQYRRITVFAALLLAAIIVTGAAVRLTGSGLGCPEWPNCTSGSFKPTDEVGIHGWIEFVNRMVTGLVSVAVIVAVLGALVRVPRRRDLTWLAIGLVIGVFAQALLGALVVKQLLSPPFVMGHFLVSAVLLANALTLVWRAGVPDGEPTPICVPDRVHQLAAAIVVAAGVVLITGTVVTGAGPHSGDAGTAADLDHAATRLDVSVSTVARIHGIAVILFLALVLGLVAVLARTGASRLLARRATLLLGLLVAQAGIGYIQYFNDVPRGLVGLHVAGATAVFAAAVGVLLGCRTPDRALAPSRPAEPLPA